VAIPVHPIMDVKTLWYSTLELLERAYSLWEFTCEWRQNPKYSEYWLLFTTQDEWTVGKYVMEVLRPIQYWTLWMSMRYTVTLHHIITEYNDMFDHMDGVMRTLAKKKTQRKEDLFFAVKSARQTFSKYYAEVIPTTGMLLICAHILDPIKQLRFFKKWDNGMDINPQYEISYTTQYEEAFLKYVENEFCTKHLLVPVTKLKNRTEQQSPPCNNGFRVLSIIV
jgi:hypothetical protein